MSSKKVFLGLAAIGFATALLGIASRAHTPPPSATYSQFLEEVRRGKVDTVSIQPGNAGAVPAVFRLKDGKTQAAVLPADYRDAMAAMLDGLVDVEIQEPPFGPLRPLLHAHSTCTSRAFVRNWT